MTEETTAEERLEAVYRRSRRMALRQLILVFVNLGLLIFQTALLVKSNRMRKEGFDAFGAAQQMYRHAIEVCKPSSGGTTHAVVLRSR